MKILFVYSGNNPNFTISPFIKSQADSLIECGIEIINYQIIGKGIKGYLRNINSLKKFILTNRPNLIHAHYTLTGWIAVLSSVNLPIVVSFMGSDTYGHYNSDGKRYKKSYLHIILAKLIQPFISAIIVKSNELKKYIFLRYKTHVIPNGVDFNKFKPIDKIQARKSLNLPLDKNLVLFLGNIDDPRKNYPLLSEAKKLCINNFIIIRPFPIIHDEVPLYLNACDVLVLTSFNEGSPNVIKEAMACNCPIVATDVGDVKEVIGSTKGCYIAGFDLKDFAEKLDESLNWNKRTTGRIDIEHLRTDLIAKKLISIYDKYIKE